MPTTYKSLFFITLFICFCLIGCIGYIVHRLGGLTYLIHRVNNRDISGIYEHRKGLFEALPKPKGGIVFLGDSLTEYGQWEELTQHPKVINRGIAGDTSLNLLRRIGHIIDLAPTKIFLMIGFNDFLFFNRHQILSNYKKVIDEISNQLPHTQLYIQSILPVNPTVRKMVVENEDIRLLNQDIQQLAMTYQLTYIDIHTLLTDEKGRLDKRFTKDGIHLNASAYAIWKDAVMPYYK